MLKIIWQQKTNLVAFSEYISNPFDFIYTYIYSIVYSQMREKERRYVRYAHTLFLRLQLLRG